MKKSAAPWVRDGDDRSGSEMRRRTAAQAIVEYLSVQYSERDGQRRRLVPGIFGIFGHGNVVGLGQALEEFGADLPYYQGKNEQAMVHAAIGYAKATRRLSTLACAASVGPGATNLITGAATATANRLPVLILASDVFMHRRQDPVLQQIEHPTERDLTVNDCFRPVSRFFDRVTRPEQLLRTLPEAMRVLVDAADTGAVTISIPQDVQGEVHDFPASFFAPRVWPVVRRPAAGEEIAAAVSLIREAERPLIIAGGGVRYSEAEPELAKLSTELGIPVAETFAGKGCGPSGDLALGALGHTGTLAANRIAASADCVICVGTRLQDFVTGSQSLFRDPDVRFVSINVGSADAHKLGALPVVGDAKDSLRRLFDDLAADGYEAEESYADQIGDAQAAWTTLLDEDLAPHAGEQMSQIQVLRTLNEITGPGDVIVTAAGTPPADVHRMWDNSNGSECHIEFGFSCMGHEIPAGLGYRLARRSDPGDVFVFIGDGTYLMNPTELVTAVQERLKVIVIVIENGGHQSIRGLQVAKTAVRFGTEFRARDDESNRLAGDYLEIDYVANARSMGCLSLRAESLEEFKAAIGTARAEAGPSVIVVPVEPHRLMSGTECFWDVGIAETSERQEMQDLTAAHLAARTAQRFYGHSPLPQKPADESGR